MSDWTSEYNAVFFTGLATSLFIFLGTLVKYGYLSKCDKIDICFGLLSIHRSVELENPDVEQPTTEQNQNQQTFSMNNNHNL